MSEDKPTEKKTPTPEAVAKVKDARVSDRQEERRAARRTERAQERVATKGATDAKPDKT